MRVLTLKIDLHDLEDDELAVLQRVVNRFAVNSPRKDVRMNCLRHMEHVAREADFRRREKERKG